MSTIKVLVSPHDFKNRLENDSHYLALKKSLYDVLATAIPEKISVNHDSRSVEYIYSEETQNTIDKLKEAIDIHFKIQYESYYKEITGSTGEKETG